MNEQEKTTKVLAQYKSRSEYKPLYGDYFIWCKWFTTWHGLVVDYNPRTDEISIVVSGVPFLLFTMPDTAQPKETIKVRLANVKQAHNGKFTILQQDKDAQHANIWFI